MSDVMETSKSAERAKPTLAQRYQMLSVEDVRDFSRMNLEKCEIAQKVVAMLNEGYSPLMIGHFTSVMPSTIHAIANDQRYGVLPEEERREILRRIIRKHREIETVKGLVRQIRKVARAR